MPKEKSAYFFGGLLLLVLMTCIAQCSCPPPPHAADDGHVISWNKVDGADYYWLYYTTSADDWSCLRRYQILNEPPYCYEVESRCSDNGELEAYVASLSREWIFVSATSVNAAGESEWDRLEIRWGCD